MNEKSSESTPYEVEVFYDGDCPICMREIRMLMRVDKKRQRIRFTDIAAPGFDAAAIGIDHGALMDRIHARLPSGEVIEGVEVFRRLYIAVGLSPLVALTRLWGVRQALDKLYGVFAKNRLKWTGRCDENGCAIPPKRSV